ncbi:MAG TPA: hypothetical protein VJ302_08740 [Blastocatellia bacterium]|nr:hypothetical protein [Blastocatellia bacterium]
MSKTRAYDHVAQILHWATYRRWDEGDQERTKVTRIALRYTFPQESSRHGSTTTALVLYGSTEIGISSR